MSGRLTSAVLASALIRKAGSEGGTGAVLIKGDPTAGALILLFSNRGTILAARERGLRPDGTSGWISAGPPDPGDALALSAYLERRRKFDADIWVVELEGLPIDRIEDLLDGL